MFRVPPRVLDHLPPVKQPRKLRDGRVDDPRVVAPALVQETAELAVVALVPPAQRAVHRDKLVVRDDLRVRTTCVQGAPRSPLRRPSRPLETQKQPRGWIR